MNRKKTTKMLVAIILMLSFSSLGSIKAISAEPKSSADGALNFWFASKAFEKDYCNDFMIAKVSVYSPTDSIPTEVKAEINGVNHTMTAPLYDISGSLNAKNFSDGIKYYYVIDTPTVGDYNLTIHAGNSSGYVASTKEEDYYNKTLALDNLGSNGTGEVNQLDQYEYLFQLSTSLDDYECIEEVVVNINETSYTMNESDFYSLNVYRDFLFIHDFGTADNDRIVNYNFTIKTSGGNYHVDGAQISLSKPVDESAIYSVAPAATDYTEDGYLYDLAISYYDGMNRAPEFILQNNDTNSSLSYVDYFSYDNGFDKVDLFKQVYTSPQTVVVEDILLEWGITHNLTLWFNNGTWNEYSIGLSSIGEKPDDLTQPTVEFSNAATTKKGDEMYVTTNITVTSDEDSFEVGEWDIIFGNTIPVNIWAPENGGIDSTFAIEVNNSDSDYTDGKTYELNYTLWDDGRTSWGDVVINVSIFYGNDTNSKQMPWNQFYATEIIDRANGPEGEYAVEAGDVLKYERTEKEKLCCSEMQESQQWVIYNITNVTYTHGTDMVKAKISYLFESDFLSEPYELPLTVSEAYPNADLKGDELIDSIGDLSAFPKGVLEKYVSAINQFPLDVPKVELSKDALTGINTLSYTQDIGEFKLEIVRTFDKNSVWRTSSEKHYLGEELIYEDTYGLEVSFTEKLTNDYLWYMVIALGGLVVLIGIAVYLKKR